MNCWPFVIFFEVFHSQTLHHSYIAIVPTLMAWHCYINCFCFMYLGAVGADLAMYVTTTSTNTRPQARLAYYAANLDRPLLKHIPLTAEKVNVKDTVK